MTMVTPLVSWRAKLWLTAILSNTSPAIILGDFSTCIDDYSNTPGLIVHWLLLLILFYTYQPHLNKLTRSILTRTHHYQKLQSYHNLISSILFFNLSILFPLVPQVFAHPSPSTYPHFPPNSTKIPQYIENHSLLSIPLHLSCLVILGWQNFLSSLTQLSHYSTKCSWRKI